MVIRRIESISQTADALTTSYYTTMANPATKRRKDRCGDRAGRDFELYDRDLQIPALPNSKATTRETPGLDLALQTVP